MWREDGGDMRGDCSIINTQVTHTRTHTHTYLRSKRRDRSK